MKQLRPRVSTTLGVLAATTAFAALCVATSALAAPYTPPAGPTSPEASTPTIYMKADKKGMRFVGPKTVTVGEELKIVNQSDPRKVGPHTFSLVTESSLPKTPKARQLCFTGGHICKSIAFWHGVKGNGPVKVNPVDAGSPGWDTPGSLRRDGDSWFTGNKPGTSFSQPVAAGFFDEPTRVYFICAVHSFMQGSINVLPGG